MTLVKDSLENSSKSPCGVKVTTSTLFSDNFSSITCFKIVSAFLIASFNVIDLWYTSCETKCNQINKIKLQNKIYRTPTVTCKLCWAPSLPDPIAFAWNWTNVPLGSMWNSCGPFSSIPTINKNQ